MLEYSEQAYRKENGIEPQSPKEIEKIEENPEITSRRSIRTISETVPEVDVNSILPVEPQMIPVA